MTNYNSIICLHGFLGRPTDWNFLPYTHIALDLFSPQFRYPLDTIGTIINDEIIRYPSPRLIIGYSMGGRLLLQALAKNDKLAEKAILVSTHFGLTDEHEKSARIKSDLIWGERFSKDPWNDVVKDWNAQNVLGGESLDRYEEDFNRASLSFAIDQWSLGRQKSMTISCPTLLIVGENDKKFLNHNMNIVKSLPNAELAVVPDTGHRVIFESPTAFASIIQCGTT